MVHGQLFLHGRVVLCEVPLAVVRAGEPKERHALAHVHQHQHRVEAAGQNVAVLVKGVGLAPLRGHSMDQSDAGSVGIFSRRTNQTQEAWVYSHDGPIRRRKHKKGAYYGSIRRRKRGYILTTDQSGAARWTGSTAGMCDTGHSQMGEEHR
eukprot:1187099-Prorocentrum_minimum.AAC.1